ncbi:Rieske (2Fe-2S) protein [Streptomyces sp. NPDC017248]|uniref:Rieske (2Fe-2S) protein n=1 Tax=unclassified Streptomyces TaxID=2593676 RepID=UPI0037AE5068
MTSASPHPAAGPGRRGVMAAAGAAGLAAALTACGTDDGSSGRVAAGAGADRAAPDGGGTALAKTADIPEGGGTVFKDHGVVVTQPTAGTYKAFSSMCTHQGCAVGGVADGVIVCPCHHSEFSAADGSVRKGPATRPLPAARITVSGDEIRLA